MVNVAGRSRGCANCRRRKVKCDETFPQCLKCSSKQLRCPGPRTGAFFVHVQSEEAQDTIATGPRKGRTSPVTLHTRNAFVHTPLVLDPRSCRATAFDQLFVSHFIESFGLLSDNRVPVETNANWLEMLPQYIASSGNSLTKNSIRSASMLSYGTWARDVSIQTEAYRWYAKALLGLQAALGQSTPTATELAVCSAVLLIHFETWAATFEGAWIQHVQGASGLLEVAGPEACRRGFMHGLFSHLRFQSFIATMYENKLSHLASPVWLSIPFNIHPPNVFDQIVTILFHAQECLFIADKLIKAPDCASKTKDELRLSHLVEKSQSMLSQWEKQFIPPYVPDRTIEIWDETSASSSESAPASASPFQFTSMPEAAILSLYHAAALMVCRLHVLAPVIQGVDATRLAIHTQEILRAYSFVRKVTSKGPTSNLGPIMMVPQLKIASLWGIEESHRMMATRILKRVEKHQSFALGSIWDSNNGYFAKVASHVVSLMSRGNLL